MKITVLKTFTITIELDVEETLSIQDAKAQALKSCNNIEGAIKYALNNAVGEDEAKNLKISSYDPSINFCS